MQLILDMPMLANHPAIRVSGPHQTRPVEAVVTRDGRVLVRRPHRFHGNDRLEAGPLCKRWERGEGCHRPDSSPHQTSVRVVERVKEVLGIAPREIVLNVVMKVLCDRSVDLLVIAL
jgi:hypothetical protein